jgi:hypothetical protein
MSMLWASAKAEVPSRVAAEAARNVLRIIVVSFGIRPLLAMLKIGGLCAFHPVR